MAESTRYEHLDRLRRADLGQWQPAAEAVDEWLHREHGITSSRLALGHLFDLLADAGYAVIPSDSLADLEHDRGGTVTSDSFATAVQALARADQRSEPVTMSAAEAAALMTVLSAAGEALNRVSKATLVVKGSLTEPYPDAPSTSPWAKFVEAPTRRAYNIGHAIRRVVREANRG